MPSLLRHQHTNIITFPDYFIATKYNIYNWNNISDVFNIIVNKCLIPFASTNLSSIYLVVLIIHINKTLL